MQSGRISPTTSYNHVNHAERPQKSSSTEEAVSIAKNVLSKTEKYPSSSVVEKLTSTLEIKRWWLYNEWSPHCQFSPFVRAKFPNQVNLHPQNNTTSTELIESTFNDVRGKYLLWQTPKESGKWRKVTVEKLELQWVKNYIEVLYPSEEQFEVTELNGLVLWKDPTKEKYQLLEGNHRVSAWLRAKEPKSLSSIIFIGKPSKA